MPGVAKNLYKSWGTEINCVCVRMGFSPNLLHIEFRQSLASPRFEALWQKVFIQNDTFLFSKLFDVSILITRGLNPARIATCLHFEFQDCIVVFYKQTSLA